MKDLDFTKIFDSMKTNDISEFVIKDGGKLYEIRRGGFKQNIVAGNNAGHSAVQPVNHAMPVGSAPIHQVIPQSSPVSVASVTTESNLYEIKSPLVGTYYGSSKPDAPAFVDVGTKVTKGQTLCIVEAMKNFNEIDCDVDGIIREVCLKSGDLVEFGKVLFRIELQ
jgi:acetyl-CoA carboxylase biotin carboxyl carrier protein